jgi:L-asparaginase
MTGHESPQEGDDPGDDAEYAGYGVDHIHGAHSLTKTSTTDVQTFLSPLRGLVGVAAYGKNDFYTTPQWKHTTQTEFDITNVTAIPRVDLIMAYLDMPGDPIDAAVAAGAKGIVIAGVGNGNMTQKALDAYSEERV